MNEITKATSAAPVKPVAVASVAVAKQPKGNPSDSKATKAPHADVEDMQAHVEAAVAQMNQYIQSTQRDLHFSYDKASGETVVKVLDRTTQEVIRQIPDETFLKLAKSRDVEGNFQLFSAQA